MPTTQTVFQVFVASPSDVAEEREILNSVIDEINQTYGDTDKIRLELVKWETHSRPGFATDPQDLINRQIGDAYDIFLGIMWGRFGTPTLRADSGTEEEFDRALSRWKDFPESIEIMFYFKNAGIPFNKIEPEQVAKVTAFKKRISSEGGVFVEFKDTAEFRTKARRHLTRFIQDRQERTRSDPGTEENANTPPIQGRGRGRKTEWTIAGIAAVLLSVAVFFNPNADKSSRNVIPTVNKPVKSVQDDGDNSVDRNDPSVTEFTDSVGIEFVQIEPGTFQMGSPTTEADREATRGGNYGGETSHSVTIIQPFYLGKYEVTQAQWRAVMENNPSSFADCGDDCPVETVFWNDTQEFIRRLNEREGTTEYRLPTEAEWEYAARAGTRTAYHFGDDSSQLCQYANFGDLTFWGSHPHYCSDGIGRSTARVGSYRPNGWGLHDMHGNVEEWVADWYGDYPSRPVTDPQGPTAGTLRLLRGGSWFHHSHSCRAASRHYMGGQTGGTAGFRLARTTRPRSLE